VAALVASDTQMPFAGQERGWRFPMAAVTPVKLMELQEGEKNCISIKEVKTCQQR